MGRVLVCGGRNYADCKAVEHALSQLSKKDLVIIQGGAKGADRLAAVWASENAVECIEFKALWSAHGSSAGPIRNQQMIDVGQPDMVIAFPGGRGTADMIRRAKRADITTIQITTASDHAAEGEAK